MSAFGTKHREQYLGTMYLSSSQTRTDFIYNVKFAKIEDPAPLPQHFSLMGMLFAQKAGIFKANRTCDACGEDFKPRLRQNEKNQLWEWAQKSGDCEACAGKQYSMARDSALQGKPVKNWMNFFHMGYMWALAGLSLFDHEEGARPQ